MIQDPVQRLKYLRWVTSTPSLSDRVERWGLAIWAHSRTVALCGGALLLLYMSRVTVANSGNEREGVAERPVLAAASSVATDAGNIWLVDKTLDVETYNNGLRIENRYMVSSEARGAYPVFARDNLDPKQPRWRSEPAGIVFHTTESEVAPFEAEENRHLKRIGAAVLSLAQHNHSYNFVVDRFGRVFRVVEEADAAYHAGNSVWADESSVYVNLNRSFLGVAFEAQTEGGVKNSITLAQIHAGRVLTDMLRSRYHIAAGNCVTHAQVSVNPSNMVVGYHTDWADDFPFAALGLPDNYAEPLGSLTLFGFNYDAAFLLNTGPALVPALLLADQQVKQGATLARMPVAEYRAMLRDRYKKVLDALKQTGAEQGAKT